MPILDLEKIVINRTVKGISCTKCGGKLKQLKKTFTGILIRILTLGLKKPKHYACEDCHKKFTVI